jgi:UDP-glucose 4-epimerase
VQTILVTGGAGFIGAGVIHRLLADGYTVRVLDDLSRGAPRRLETVKDWIEFQNGDIRNPETVSRACAGVQRVMHLAYINGTRFFYEEPELVLDVAVRGMLNVLDSCRAHDVRELVLMSSSEVYQTPPRTPTAEDAPLTVPDVLNPRYSYGGGKIACELMAINYGRTGVVTLLKV